MDTVAHPADARSVLILVNPKAGRRSMAAKVEEAAGRLRQEGFWVEIHTGLAEVAERANQLHAAGELRALVGVGGDGTAAELVNRTRPGLPLALFPAGTSNLLARHFAIRPDPEQLCRAVTHGTRRVLDAGCANGRLFLLMLGVGFDADVVQRVHAHRGKSGSHISFWTYCKPIWRSIRTYQYPEFQIECLADEGMPEQFAARWAFLCNFPRYGWGVKLAPRADAADGLLDLYCFRRGGLFHGLKYVAAIELERQERLADCTVRRLRRMRIAASQSVPYQLDGDPGGVLPVEVEVLPGRLTLIVPEEKVG